MKKNFKRHQIYFLYLKFPLYLLKHGHPFLKLACKLQYMTKSEAIEDLEFYLFLQLSLNHEKFAWLVFE